MERLGAAWHGGAWFGMAWFGMDSYTKEIGTMDSAEMDTETALRETRFTNGTHDVLSGVSNAEREASDMPYTVEFELWGTRPILFHSYNAQAVQAKATAKKNSKEKKEDNVESYVTRNESGEICIPAEYIRMSIIGAARYKQDPRSPRKSAMDLYKASVFYDEDMFPILSDGAPTKEWDYLDQRRVVVQRSAITRVRPAFHKGWRCVVRLQCTEPGYISASELLDTLTIAGKSIGLGDFRPSFGKFQVSKYAAL